MNIRPFDWRDLPILHRYRSQGLFFDSASVLTRGMMLVPAGALLSYFAPATGIFTYLYDGNQSSDLPLLGQVVHSTGAAYARLSFLAPEAALESGGLSALLDQIALHVGERGAFHILAEIDEHSPAYDALHRSGFAIYARQRIWQLIGAPVGTAQPTPWRACTSKDLTEAHALYNNVVPGLVQQAEPFPRHRLRGLIYYQEGDIIAYVEYRYGLRGIWVQPFIHPDAGDFVGRLVDMLQALPNRRSRPVYLCIRSYQSWLETTVKEMGAQPGPVQAVMVRHLALSRRITQPLAIPAINGSRAEPTVPVAHIEQNE